MSKQVKPYRYYDTPDGQDLIKKLWCVMKPATAVAVGIGTYDVMLYSKPKGYTATLRRFGYIAIPVFGMTTVLSGGIFGLAAAGQKQALLNGVVLTPDLSKPRMHGDIARPILKYTKALPEAFAPYRKHETDAGYDLKSVVDCTVPARGKALVDTGLKLDLPEGCYGRVAPRSGLAAKNFIDVGAGVIDDGYRDNVKVVLFNHSDKKFVVKKGDRIAQLICERIFYPDLQEEQELCETARGEGGFGSTGTN